MGDTETEKLLNYPITHTQASLLINEATISNVNNTTTDSAINNNKNINNKKNKKYEILKRWYVLILFSLASATQSCIWASWAPITSSAEKAYNLSRSDIALLTNYGPITYVIGTPFLMLLMHKRRLNSSIITLTFTITLCMSLRCICTNKTTTFLLHIAQILNGFVGPIAMAGSPLLSAVWFHGSSLATAISTCANAFGAAISFFGPFIVTDPIVHNCIRADELRDEIMIINYALGCLSFVVFIGSIFLPSEPNHVQIPQTFRQDICLLLPKKGFWLLVIPYALSQGIFGMWASVIYIIVKPLNMNQLQAGWMGFVGSIVGQVVAIILARINDIFKISRGLMISLYAISIISLLLFNFNNLYFRNITILYVSYVFNAVVLCSAEPLWYTLICVPPIHQSSTAGLSTLLYNVVSLIFLGILSSNLGVGWTNWAILISSLICIPPLFLYKTSS